MSYHNKLIMVCAECLTASCWHGEFMCQKAQTAATNLLPVKELRRLKLEHPDNWAASNLARIYGTTQPFGYQGEGT